MSAAVKMQLDRGLPMSLDSERFVLGWLLECDTNEPFVRCLGVVESGDFALESHQILFRAMKEIDSRGLRLDRVQIAEFLHARGFLDAVGGLAGILALSEGIPRIPDIGGYLRIIREKSILRRTISTCQKTINECLLAQDGSTEVIDRASALLNGLAARTEQAAQWTTPGNVLATAGSVQEFVCPPAGAGGMPLPWPTLDERICGLQKGEFMLIAGRPSSGKSAAGMQIAWHAARNGWDPAFISLEVGKEAMTKRLLSQVSKVDSHKMRTGYTNAFERDLMNKAALMIGPEPFWIDDTRNQSPESIRQSLKRRQQEGRVGCIIIDHFHLVKGTGREELRERFSRIADSFQDMAGEFDCPLIALAQLNRKCEDENRAPGLSDLMETGKLEQNADVILFTHRPELYARNRQREELRNKADLIIAKQRNGPTGIVEMVWIPSCQTFEERAY